MSPDADFLDLPTNWSAIRRAAAVDAAEWRSLLHYYLPAVRAYLYGCCRNDRDLADELVQTFSVQFLGGAFRRASQDRGPFRHYLKRSLSNLVTRAMTARAQDQQRQSGDDVALLAADEATAEERFTSELVGTILDRAWATLRTDPTAAPYYDCLRIAVELPDASSETLAAHLAAAKGEPYTAERFRKILSRARHKFATHVYDQVASGLDDPTPAAVAAELAELRLLPYCAAVVRQHAVGNSSG